MNTPKLFGVWITRRDGSTGWLSDEDLGIDIWAGTKCEASAAASERQRCYPHLRYEVRPIKAKGPP